MTCSICNNIAVERLKKLNTIYYQCSNCLTVFSGYIEQDGKVGGGNEEARNVIQNPERIARIEALTKNKPKSEVFIVDFGAGFGRLVNDLKAAGFVNTIGYDPFNPEFASLPEKNKFDVCICVECAEHWAGEYHEAAVISRSLKSGGVAIFETSFTNVAEQEGIDLQDFDYLSPLPGHSTLFSFHGMDLLMIKNNLYPIPFLNRHVRLYCKK